MVLREIVCIFFFSCTLVQMTSAQPPVLNDSTGAYDLYSIGRKFFDNPKTTDSALIYFKKSEVLYQSASAFERVAFLQSFSSRCYRKLRDYENAESQALSALKLLEKSNFGSNAKIHIFNTLCILRYEQGKLEDALHFLKKVKDERIQFLGKSHPEVAMSLRNIGVIYENNKKLDSARHYYFEAMKIFSLEEFTNSKSEHLKTLTNIAISFKKELRFDSAMYYFNLSNTLAEDSVLRESKEAADMFSKFSSTLLELSKYDSAELMVRRGFHINEKIYPKQSVEYGLACYSLAGFWSDIMKHDSSLYYRKTAYTIFSQKLGIYHRYSIGSLNGIGVSFEKMLFYDSALHYFDQGIRILESSSDKGLKNELYNFLINKANILTILFRHTEAHDLLVNALIKLGDRPEHLQVKALIYMNLTNVLNSLGQYKKAEKSAQKSLSLKKAIYGDSSRQTGRTYNLLFSTYMNLKKFDKARHYAQKGLSILKPVFSEEHPDIIAFYNNIAQTYRSEENYDSALFFYKKALRIAKKSDFTTYQMFNILYGNLGRVNYLRGEFEEAVNYTKRSIDYLKINESDSSILGNIKFSVLYDEILENLLVLSKSYFFNQQDRKAVFTVAQASDFFSLYLKDLVREADKLILVQNTRDINEAAAMIHFQLSKGKRHRSKP